MKAIQKEAHADCTDAKHKECREFAQLQCDALNEEMILKNAQKVEENSAAEKEGAAEKCRCMPKKLPASVEDSEKCEGSSQITTPDACPADRCEWGPTNACKLQAAAAAKAKEEKEAEKKPPAKVEKSCKDAMCTQDLCADGKPRRMVGQDCCACPAVPAAAKSTTTAKPATAKPATAKPVAFLERWSTTIRRYL